MNMKKMTVIIFIVSLLNACFPGRLLKTETMRYASPEGVFTVILYGGTYSNDPKTVAILDLEGDDYAFEPYASDYEYVIRSGVSAQEALADALRHISRHPFYSRPLMKKILDGNGRIIGYELRPLFSSLKFGSSDILNIPYELRDKRVVVSVNIKDSIKKKFRNREMY